MFYCVDCESLFENPNRVKEGFDHWFGTEAYIDDVCPFCGGEAVECHICECGGYMTPNDKLCSSCRKDLAGRFAEFCDTLTAEQEEQLDTWLDGNSVTDRSKFA